MRSEFGKGFIYNLVLFSKHWWRINEDRYDKDVEMWFNGAGDHFFEFTIPRGWSKTEIGKLAKDLQTRALDFRLCYGDKKPPTKDDFNIFFEDLEKLCRMIDEKLGVKTIKADWN